MLIARHLKDERIRLDMETQPLAAAEREEMGPRHVRVEKEAALAEIAAFLEETSPVGNAKRLLADLVNRERKASTAVGRGLALPHVRTMNVKAPIVALLRSVPGLEFDSPDKEPVHIFLVLVAPPYDDRIYLKLYKEAGELFLRDDVMPFLLGAVSTTEILNFFRAPERFTEEW